MLLVALTGLPKSGKNMCADYLTREHNFAQMAFADPLKEASAILLARPISQMRGDHGYDREQPLPEWADSGIKSVRDFLQRFGTEAIRDNFGADFWVKHMRYTICNYAHSMQRGVEPCIAITDCRFENEAAMVRELGGTVIQITRPGTIKSGHVSDAGVIPDGVLFNDSTPDDLFAQLELALIGVRIRAASKSRSAGA